VGRPVAYCLQEITNREFRTWQAKFEADWVKPNRTDYYLMLIAHRIMYVLGKTPKTATLEQQKLKFATGGKKPGFSKAKTALLAKARWIGMLGIGRKKE